MKIREGDNRYLTGAEASAVIAEHIAWLENRDVFTADFSDAPIAKAYPRVPKGEPA